MKINDSVALVTGANRGLGRHFADQLLRRGAKSAMTWFAVDGAGSYGVAKSAQWALTNSIRLELAAQGTAVTGLHLSITDTDMVAGFDMPKNDPADVVATALDGVEAGVIEIIADSDTAMVKAALAGDPAALYAQLA